MNLIKRISGYLWMVIGILSMAVLFYSAVTHIGTAKGDIGKPIPWIIIIGVFTPIAIGLIIFGWYAVKGEYDREEPSSMR